MEQLRGCKGARAIPLLCMLLVQLIVVTGVQADGTVLFVDSKAFLRLGHNAESEMLAFSYSDVAASVAVLLGVVPQVAVSQLLASKLDSLVSPDPFHRPGAVLLLNIGVVEPGSVSDGELLEMLDIKFYQHRPLATADSRAFELSGDDVKLELLTNSQVVAKDAQVSEQDIIDMISFLGGSWSSEQGAPVMTSTLSVPLGSHETITLDLSESVDLAFLKELVFLVGNIKRAVALQQALNQDPQRPADLYFGRFSGIEGFRKQYGSGSRTLQASKLVFLAASKVLKYLQANYNDKFVGVFTLVKDTGHNNEFKITVSQRSARILQGTVAPSAAPTPEVLALQLANRAIVFFTVIILIVALLLSTCCLFTMPVTGHSLFYSGLKLD